RSSRGRLDPAVEALIDLFPGVEPGLELREAHGPDESFHPAGAGIIQIDEGRIRSQVEEPAAHGVREPPAANGEGPVGRHEGPVGEEEWRHDPTAFGRSRLDPPAPRPASRSEPPLYCSGWPAGRGTMRGTEVRPRARTGRMVTALRPSPPGKSACTIEWLGYSGPPLRSWRGPGPSTDRLPGHPASSLAESYAAVQGG